MRPDEMPGGIWVFQEGRTGRFAGGLFTSVELAEAWIKKNRLSGILTLYPVDTGVYDWAIEHGLFSPKKPHESEPSFIGGFTTASQPHEHYEDGLRS